MPEPLLVGSAALTPRPSPADSLRFLMTDRSGPLAARSLTVEGGFNATVAEP